MMENILKVGGGQCDIKGFTNVHIQCAIDRMAFLGGGTVELSKGTFTLSDAVHMRSNVQLRGQGDGTVLMKDKMRKASVGTFLGFGHYDIIVDKPDIFEHGDGIIIGDDNSFGFYQTTGTLVRRDGDVWFTSNPHAHDYLKKANGFVKTLFSGVSAVDVNDAKVSDLVIDGNAGTNERLNSCRGGGFFAHRANRIEVENIKVRDFNGEGFSFQTCDDMKLVSCLAERCTGNGFHPGSGSNRFLVSSCVARGCGQNGLFYCLRARYGTLEDCLFERNKGHGVSIGGRDTDNMNRKLVIRRNGGAGIYLRDETVETAPHRNIIAGCKIENNCQKDGEAEIVLQGSVQGISITGNRILRNGGKPGILVSPGVVKPVLRNNRIIPSGPGSIVK